MLSLLAAAGGAADPIYWSDLGMKPYLFDLGGFQLRYYSLAYLIGVVFAYWHLSKMLKSPGAPMAQRHADDLFFYCTLGVILGGRLGYAAFYTGGDTGIPSAFTDFSGDGFVSWKLLRLWDGGMSFHGGLLGVLAAIGWVSWRGKAQSFLACATTSRSMYRSVCCWGGSPTSTMANCGAAKPMFPGVWYFPQRIDVAAIGHRATQASFIRRG